MRLVVEILQYFLQTPCTFVCVWISSVRACGAEKSLKLLMMEDSSSHKLPALSDINLHSLDDLFIVRSPRSLINPDTSAPSVCQAINLSMVYYASAPISHSFNANWTVTVYSFVVYMYLIVSVDCIGFDHTLFINLYSAIFAASMSINIHYSV